MNGQNCSVLRTDVAGFSSPTRTNEHRRTIRRVQYEIVKQSFEESGIRWEECYTGDRGDGVLVVTRPDVSTELLVKPLIATLIARLSRHNAAAEDATSFQLRAALHVGPVKSDPQGVNGDVIIYVSRLVEAPVFKQQLAESEACLGFIASPFVYDSFIKQCGRVDPAEYRKVGFRANGSNVTGWMYLGGTALRERQM